MKTFLRNRALALTVSTLPALGLPLGLAGLAAGAGEAAAQAQNERILGECASLAGADPGSLPPGASDDDVCFTEYIGGSRSDIRLEFHEALICEPGEEDCVARATTERLALRERIRFVRESPLGVELSSRSCSEFTLALSGAGGTCFMFMTVEASTRTETVTRLDTSERSDVFTTRITGQIGGATVFDETRDLPFAAPDIQALVSQAGLAVTASGGPGVVVLAPVLLERTESLVDSTIQTLREVVGEPVLSFTFNPVTGPDTIAGGTTLVPANDNLITAVLTTDLGLCETASTVNNGPPPTGCENSGAVAAVPFGVSANLVYLNTHTDVLETVTGTETWVAFEHWDIAGIVQALGTVNASVRSGGYDMNARFLRRLMAPGAVQQPASLGGVPLAYAREPDRSKAAGAVDRLATGAIGDAANINGAGFRYHGWLESYGGTASAAAQGAAPGDRRTAWGLSGGAAYSFANGLTLGFGVDRGRTDVSLAAVGESGDIELTQFGLSARFDAGRWFAGGALSYGLGEVETTQTLGGVSTAAYDLTVFGLTAETGYRFDLGGVMLTPSAGLDFTHLRTSAFTGAGGAALAAPAFSSERTRAFAGLGIAKYFETDGGGRLELSGSARIVGVLSGEERLLPVVLVSAPGAPLTVTGASEGRIGLDLGAEARYRFTAGAEIFARYDGEFRKDFDAHQGTVGLRISW